MFIFCVFAAAARPLITDCLCVAGQMMLTSDEFNLTLTIKKERKHDATAQNSFCVCADCIAITALTNLNIKHGALYTVCHYLSVI